MILESRRWPGTSADLGHVLVTYPARSYKVVIIVLSRSQFTYLFAIIEEKEPASMPSSYVTISSSQAQPEDRKRVEQRK